MTKDNQSRYVYSSSTAGRAKMLQWKPRFYAILTLAALAVAAFGGYAGDTGDTLRQFGW
jgi:hypothetical protein